MVDLGFAAGCESFGGYSEVKMQQGIVQHIQYPLLCQHIYRHPCHFKDKCFSYRLLEFLELFLMLGKTQIVNDKYFPSNKDIFPK